MEGYSVETTLFRELFIHRSDVFAVQHPDGSYAPVRRPLEKFDVMEHLAGFASYGVYVVDPVPWGGQEFGNSVRYVVFDLDTYNEDALEFLCRAVELLVSKLYDQYTEVDYHCLLLENSGGKGYHIWLFFSEPLPAAQVRRWAEPVRVAYNDHNLNHTIGRDWPELEIFPKQNTVPEGGFGNLVKLPLGTHAVTGRKSEILNVPGWGNCVDKGCRLDSSLIPDTPAEVRSSGSGSAVTSDGDREAPFACIAKLIAEGAPEGCRDRAMFHLAHYAWGTGLPRNLVQEWCDQVNEKFDPPLSDQEVRTKVHSAGNMEASHPSCNADWLQGFCPGGEKCFAAWNRQPPTHPKIEAGPHAVSVGRPGRT